MKDSILGSMRDKHKPKSPFTWKSNKSKIEVLLYQCLTFNENNNAEDDTVSENSSEYDNFISINSRIAKTINAVDLCNLLFTVYKKEA